MSTKDKIEALEKELAKLKKSFYFPQKGDNYYFYNVNGLLCSTTWEDSFGDYKLKSRCNIFQTKKEAETEVEKLKLLSEIKQWRRDNDPDGFELDWTDINQPKYYVYYDHYEGKLSYDIAYGIQPISVSYFSSKDYTKKFIDYFGDRLNLLLEGGN